VLQIADLAGAKKLRARSVESGGETEFGCNKLDLFCYIALC
jgi:hypothetical protein